jgi:hypothetical protein
MDAKNLNNTKPGVSAPQMQVRSDVRSGGDLETCQFNLNKWRERYNYWYKIAQQRGLV